ncbi:HAD family hydrolase [Paludibacterium purpuratum]|uniref:HAD superfamily hydrolase (TIGR01490 family) n=1 Tax=Paludibacterium purpuratum TaxID=1144873 RepID=A0A4R7BCY3_9NEIS|nr:HAD family hydrolase [Paludibacterium purpuratum]TDR81487.1 HAD superfamily hydrolase (TIGR01490 family) [Paludibacterium purpuratum]
MPLAIFDLDDTLIDGDSSSLFLRFLVEIGQADADMPAREAAMMDDYRAGRLAMDEYMRFTLQPLQQCATEQVAHWAEVFLRERILPRVFPQAHAALAHYRDAGWRIVIISATGEHLVRPIAAALGVADVLAIRLASADGRYTGQTVDTLTYQQGKVIRLNEWLAAHGETLDGSHGYSDSINDVPLLAAVDRAHVVNPDARLAVVADERQWHRLAWRSAF